MTESSSDDAVSPNSETEAADVTTEASSTAETKGAEPTLLEAVKASLKQPAQKETTPDSEEREPAESADPKDAAAEAQEPLGEITDEELKRYKPNTRRRIEQLLGDRTTRDEQIKTLEPRAKQFDEFQSFVKQQGISQEGLSWALEVVPLAARDPEAAWAKVLPLVQHLAKVTGRVLPEELQERVRQGYLTEGDAQRIATSEAQRVHAERQRTAEVERLRQEQQQAEEDRQQRETAAKVKSVSDAADTWESMRRRSDPDFAVKQPRIAELVELEVRRNGFPEGATAAHKMFEDIHERVSAEFRKLAPPPKPVKAVTAVSTRGTAEPKTALEAAKLFLGTL
jgi:hypothetical protein